MNWIYIFYLLFAVSHEQTCKKMRWMWLEIQKVWNTSAWGDCDSLLLDSQTIDFNLLLRIFSSQQSHKKWHECNPGFICAVCRFTFSDADSLRDHINLHETKPYTECLFCGKNFKANSHLRYHVETHVSMLGIQTNPKKKFIRIIFLNVKMKIFLQGGRNKLCDLCGKAFKTETALERHVNIHTKKRSYECSICKKQFTEYNNMKYHMKNHVSRHILGIWQICK